MGRRLDKAISGITVGAAVLIGIGTQAGAEVYEPPSDLPDGTPGAPAGDTPASTTDVVGQLPSSDIDAFAICMTDPAAFHLVVGGVDDAGDSRSMDTVVWLFDPAGLLVAMNDDAPSGGRGSELVPGSAAATVPGVHTVAVAHFRTRALDVSGVDIDDAAEGPLASWYRGSGSNHGPYRASLVAGASGSEGCGDEPPDGGGDSHGVMTGSGRCQELGGRSAPRGRTNGLDNAAEHRNSESC